MVIDTLSGKSNPQCQSLNAEPIMKQSRSTNQATHYGHQGRYPHDSFTMTDDSIYINKKLLGMISTVGSLRNAVGSLKGCEFTNKRHAKSCVSALLVHASREEVQARAPVVNVSVSIVCKRAA